MTTIQLRGDYVSHRASAAGADGTTNRIWKSMVDAHQVEFPPITECVPGTFNVWITDPRNYVPPNETKYRELSRVHWNRPEGHHISPVAKITRINDVDIECWIYRGGHNDKPIIELLARIPLAANLNIKPNQPITLQLTILPEGSPGMPKVPGR